MLKYACLGLEHYNWAEVRLVTCFDSELKMPRLVFSTILLHPDYVPKPEPMQGVLRSEGTKEKLYFRRVVMSASQAVDWYADLANDSKTPKPTKPEDVDAKCDGINLACPNLLNEMEWPSLAMPINKSADLTGFRTFKPAPFVGEINSRIHRKFGEAGSLEHLLKDKKAVDFIERCAHINLANYPEYLASACLVVPNPLIQKVDNFLIQKENSEAVFHRFIARPGKLLDGLRITIYEENNSLLTYVHTQDIPSDGIIELERPKCMGEYGYDVMHKEYGLILRHQPTGFLRQIGLSMNVVSKQFEVTAPINSKKSSLNDTYVSTQVTKADESVIGTGAIPHNFNARVARASEQRRLKATAKEQNQKFFPVDSREKAMDFIRSLISKARRQVVIADPYFSHLQNSQFLYAIRNAEVSIDIVTSQLVFSGNAQERAEKAKVLKDELARAESETGRKINTKVLTGKSPILHDRFLVVDKDVWFMGNSLSDIGQRASMILKVPYPEEVLSELLAIQQAAVSLENFINSNDTAQI